MYIVIKTTLHNGCIEQVALGGFCKRHHAEVVAERAFDKTIFKMEADGVDPFRIADIESNNFYEVSSKDGKKQIYIEILDVQELD